MRLFLYNLISNLQKRKYNPIFGQNTAMDNIKQLIEKIRKTKSETTIPNNSDSEFGESFIEDIILRLTLEFTPPASNAGKYDQLSDLTNDIEQN